MLAHYLTLALRNLRRAPLTSAINVFTLALGLVAFVAAYAVVNYWNNSERHFGNAPRTFVITANMALRDGSIATGTIPQTNELYARYLALEFPEFEAIAKANLWSREASISIDGRGERVAALAVDPTFLDIFDLPFLAGDPRSALLQPDGVLLTEQAALRLFGSTEVLGRTLSLGGNLLDATVTGVLAPLPQPSHLGDSAAASLRFDLIAPWGLYERLRSAVAIPAAAQSRDAAPAETAPPPAANENWLGGYCCTTYVMLRPDSRLSEATLNARLTDFAERRMAPELLQMASVRVGAVPVSGLMVSTLNAQLLGGAQGAASITTLLFAVAALVLGVACVNYANLATAQALRRAREIGLRKALGAQRRQVALQHLCEAALLSATALALALLAVVLLAPLIQTAIGMDLRLGLFADGRLWFFLLALLLSVTLLAGGYPAFLLSRLRPTEALQLGRLRQGPRRVSALLVGAQFAAASLLVIAVIVMQLQNLELRRGGLGQTRDPYLVLSNFQPVTRVDNERLLGELERLPQVTGLTQMGAVPWSDNVNLTLFTRDPGASATPVTAYWNTVGHDFFAVMDLPLVAGRVFSRERNDLPPENGADLSQPRSIVIDRPYAAQLGFATPEEAVDALVYEPSQFGPERPARIIGVVESRPLYLRGFGATANAYGLGETAALQQQIVRLALGELGAGLAAIDAAWRDMGALVPLQRRFLDDLFEENYRNFARINQAFAGLAVFAIVIALIGLFGMALQTTSRRLHEIGLRKSLGAESGQILGMLLYAFSKPVLLANLLAWPLAFLVAQSYLSIFIQRVQLTPLPFVLSLVLVLLVAGLAVSSQALRAARSTPAAVLRGD